MIRYDRRRTWGRGERRDLSELDAGMPSRSMEKSPGKACLSLLYLSSASAAFWASSVRV